MIYDRRQNIFLCDLLEEKPKIKMLMLIAEEHWR